MPNAPAFLTRLACLLSLALLPALPGCRQTSTSNSGQTQRSTRRPSNSDSGSSSGGSSRVASGDNSSLLLGNASNATEDGSANNLLLELPQYSSSYNATNGEPNWVAWHLESSDLGSTDRSTFRPNTALKSSFQIRPTDYRGSGYDRGHVCPSGDRTRRVKDNEATFLMSNMLPQAPALNQQVWKRLEDHCRDLAGQGNELYIVAGGAGTSGRIAGGRVNVPAACWKVIVVLPRGDNDLARINARTRVIAVAMPNKDTDVVARASWSQYIVSPARIEKATGLSFFVSLPTNVRAALENSVDAGRDDDESGSGGRARQGNA